MSSVQCDFSEFKEFFDKMETAAKGAFRQEMELFLMGIGEEFLRVLGEEIKRKKVMDTRNLLNSFHRGHEANVWEIEADGLVLEVGTNVEYASYVNDGHWIVKHKRDEASSLGDDEKARFVPGTWDDDNKFTYDPNAKTGIVLRKWVKGAHYWESALRIMEKIFPQALDRRLQEWLDRYFG